MRTQGRHAQPFNCAVFALALTAGCANAEPSGTKAHWAFLPPERPTPPLISKHSWPRNDVDHFVLKRIEDAGLRPSPEANQRTLLRRLHFDLTGLPPSLTEITAFEADINNAPDAAFEKCIDQLLASPHFGEKWARWWMDLAHYGDSDGYLTDQPRPVAWRWRQWVVEAFNRNLPFDQFTVEQLAGDLLPNANTQQRIATGFLRNTLSNREGGADIEEYRVLQVKDRTSTFGTVWLGLTVTCAQCHDHKYDPVSQNEFYQLYAFFNNADELNITVPLPGEGEKFAPAKKEYDRKRLELLAPVADELSILQRHWETKLLDTEANPGRDHHWDRELELLGLVWGSRLGEGQLEGLNIIYKPRKKRTSIERDRLQDYFLRSGSRIDTEKFNKLKVIELVRQLDTLQKALPPVTRAPTMTQHHEYRPTHLHNRGNFRQKGDEVRPGVPAVLHSLRLTESPDRLELALWAVSPGNPITARVMVNRLWQELFGRGLVATPGDFGMRGTLPSHPKLLDWLAAAFVQRGWDMKAMLKVMLMSATYRQDSRQNLNDPENILLTRYARQRLPAELIRDNALAVSGLLNRKIGGPSVRPPQPESVIKEAFEAKWKVSEGANRYRRGLYTFIQRSAPFGQMITFDFPENNQPCTRRERSNTPLQALNLLNDPVFFRAAQVMAARVQREGGQGIHKRLDYAFHLCLARAPQPAERDRLAKYLQTQTAILSDDPQAAREMAGEPTEDSNLANQAAWVGVASVLLNLDEFITKQ
ncbi:MAG: DUF1549 and DUF1553 domain-containing protein [Verrucomicrobiales bacterium]